MKTDRKAQAKQKSPKAGAGRGAGTKRVPSNGEHPPVTYEHAPIGIVEASLEGKYLNVNEEFCRILGYEKKELLQRGIKDFTHEDDYSIDFRLHEQLVAGKIPFYRLEKRFVRKDNSSIWVELTRSIVRDAKETPLYTVGVILDISDRKDVERVLRESVERLRLATEAAQMFTWEWDFQHQTYTLADSFEQVLGFSGGLLPRNHFDTVGRLIPREDLQAITDAYQAAIHNQSDLHPQACRVRNPGTDQLIWLEISAKIVYNDQKQPVRMFGVAQNITASKNTQEEIRVISRVPEENPNPVMRLTPDGRVLYANGPSQELLKVWKQQIDRTIPDELQNAITEAFNSGVKKQVEIEHRGKFFSCTLAPILDAGYVNFYGNEITARKQAEEKLRESEERFRALVSQATAGIAESDMDSALIFVNPRFCEMLGYSMEEMLGKTIWELTYTDDLEENKRLFQRMLSQGESYQFEKRFIRKDGSLLWTNVTVSSIRDLAGNPKGGVGVVIDIEQRKQAEQAIKEFAREQEALYRLADQLHRTGSFADVFNAALDAILSALQCDRASILLFDDQDVMRFVAWRGLSEEYRRATDGHSPWTPETTNPEPIAMGDVETADLSTSLRATIKQEGIGSLAFIPLVSNGKLIGKFMVYFNRPHAFREDELDLSLTIARQLAFGIDRKRAEEKLRKSEERFRQAADASSALVYEVDPRSGATAVVYGMERLVGYNPEETLLSSDWWHSLIHPDDLPLHLAQLDRLREEGGTDVCEYRVQHRNGNWIIVQDNRILITDGAGQPMRLIGGVIDITERKRMEEALRIENERFMRFVDSNIVGILIGAASGDVILANDYYLRLLGVSRQDLNGGKVDWQKFTPPEWQPADEKAIRELRERGVCEPYEKEYMRADGTRVPVYIANAMLPGPGDEIAAFVLDITERKRAEETLRRNEELFSTLVEAAPFGVYFIDSAFRLRAVNKGSEAVFSGIHPLIGRDFAEVLRIVWQEPFATEAIEHFRHTLRTGEPFISPPVIEPRANIDEIQSYDWQIHRITMPDGTYGVVCYFYDLSEQKRMEATVRASEALYRTIARSIPDGGVYVVDKDFRYLVAEGPVTEAFGLSREMLEGHTVLEVFNDERGERMKERLQQSFAGETLSFETTYNGRVYWTRQAPLSNSIGQAIILTLDITERKQAEEALRESEARLRAVFDGTYEYIGLLSPDGTLLEANRASLEFDNETREHVVGRPFWETGWWAYTPGAAEALRKSIEQAAGGEFIRYEAPLHRRSGETIIFDFSLHPVYDESGKVMFVVPEGRNITERKKVEEALRESEERFHAILRQATAGIVRKDEKGRLIFVNQAFCNMLGYTEAELLGKTMWDLMHEDDVAENQRSYNRLLLEGIPFKLERRLIREDGSVIWVDASVSPIMDAEGKPQSAVTVEVDITGRKQAEAALQQLNLQLEERVLSRTAKLRAVNQTLRDEILERKRAEEALRKSEAVAHENEEKLRSLFELLPVGISFLNLEGQIIQMNTALLDILKLSREEFLQRAYKARRYIRADGTPMPSKEFASARAIAENRTIYNVETGIVLEDGAVIWTSVSAAPVDVADVSVVVVTVDITDTKRAEQALQESHARLRILSQRLVEVQEEERRALARELHDRVGQTLAALNINLIIINSQLSGEAAEQIGTRLNDSMKLVAETIALVRDVMTDLRPAVLDDYGLEAAIESHLSQYIARYPIKVRFEKPTQAIPRLGPSIEMTFLRIAQEALMNIARHAQATQVKLSLRQEQDEVCMTIQDNGIGIQSWQEANRPGSHGLTIMRERAEAFGGNLHVRSVPGQGTTIDVTIPLRSQKESRQEKSL